VTLPLYQKSFAHSSSFHFSVITSPPSGSHGLAIDTRAMHVPMQTRIVDLENITSARVPADRLAICATERALSACLMA
jgi:hypothetical protein